MNRKVFLFILFFTLSACDPDKVTLAVAANLTPVIPDLVRAFHSEYPEIKVEYTLSSSGKLAAQIMQGADFDIFLSADNTRPQVLFEKGKAMMNPKVYALGRLIFIQPGVKHTKGLKELLIDPSKRYFSMANPVTAPYGTAALEVLQKLDIPETTNKAVFSMNVAQAVQYVLTAGTGAFIPLSALYKDELANILEEATVIIVDDSLYTPIRQSAVLLKGSDDNAALFYKFIFSEEARKILVEGGYGYE